MIESCYVNLLQAVDDEYAEMNAMSGPTCTVNVTFEKEEIILEFGKEESGWKITPNAYPNVSLYCATTVLTEHYAPFVYKPPPYYLHEFAAEVYLSPIYAPLSLCNSNE